MSTSLVNKPTKSRPTKKPGVYTMEIEDRGDGVYVPKKGATPRPFDIEALENQVALMLATEKLRENVTECTVTPEEIDAKIRELMKAEKLLG
jgi:hypothetical protein